MYFLLLIEQKKRKIKMRSMLQAPVTSQRGVLGLGTAGQPGHVQDYSMDLVRVLRWGWWAVHKHRGQAQEVAPNS